MSDFVDPDLGPGDMFGGLDDPTPPAFGGELLPGVMKRGQHLRNQRRMAYAVGSACVAVLVAGAGIGLAGGSSNNGAPTTPLHPKPSVSHTKKPHHHHTQSPGATVGGTQSGGKGKGGHHPTQSCVTATPTPGSTDATPTDTPTPAESLEPTPLFTDSPQADDGATTSPTPTPTSTDCATPTSSSTDAPAGSDTPTPTYSIPPLLSEWHPWIEMSRGIL